ncbi:MAG: MTH1187 family thiamine-binding protein [Planctomycetia bacterium]|nr:MTH1187 family thiamine-binding protein [Planctomycetia bacterium]
MLAEFSVYPVAVEHMSKDVAKVVDVLSGTGLAYRVGPMGTCIEGNLGQVLAVIQRCHEAVANAHGRVVTTIVIDDRKDQPHHLAEVVPSVEKQLGHKVPT